MKGLNDYVVKVVCEELRKDAEPSVQKLLKIMDIKYRKNENEKYQDFIEEIFRFKESSKTDPEEFWEEVRALTKKAEDLDRKQHTNDFLMCLMLRRELGILSVYEQDEIKRKVGLKGPPEDKTVS